MQKLYKTLNLYIFCIQRLYKSKFWMIINVQKMYIKFLHIYKKCTNNYILYFPNFDSNNDAIFRSISQLCKVSGPIFSYAKDSQMNLYYRFI